MQPMNLISTYLLFSIPPVSLSLILQRNSKSRECCLGAGREEKEEFPSRSTVSSDYLFFFFFFLLLISSSFFAETFRKWPERGNPLSNEISFLLLLLLNFFLISIYLTTGSPTVQAQNSSSSWDSSSFVSPWVPPSRPPPISIVLCRWRAYRKRRQSKDRSSFLSLSPPPPPPPHCLAAFGTHGRPEG